MVTDRECELCKAGLEDKIEAIRREIRIGVVVSTTLTGIFITILGVLLSMKVV